MSYSSAKTTFEATVVSGPAGTLTPSVMRSQILNLTDALNAAQYRPKGAWSHGTDYLANDIVFHQGSTFYALQNHTSSASDEPGVGATWGSNWGYLAQKGTSFDASETEVSSDTTTDIGAVETFAILISGTTTIESFGSEPNLMRFVRFGDSLTLTHDATSLIIPGGANVTTAAGDCLIAISDSSGNWRVVNYQYAADIDRDVGLDFTAITDVASASTTDLGAAATDVIRITGTTGISSFGTGVNKLKLVYFAGILTLTHDGTSLILPTGADITTAAGDSLTALSDGSGNWRIISYQRADGSPVAGASSGGGPSLGNNSVLRINDLDVTEDITLLADSDTVESVDTGADTLTLTAHVYIDGQRVRIKNSGGALPTGLAADTDYWVVSAAANTIKLSATRGGSAIDITGAGSGTHTVFRPQNAMSAGPVTVASGVTVTIESGSTWTVV